MGYPTRRSELVFRLNQRRLRVEAIRGRPRGSVRAASRVAERVVALSYDDGPSPRNTPELLQILAAAGARATFFAVGTEVARHPELVSRIADSGSEVANHSYSHRDFRDLDEGEIRAEIESCAEAITAAGVSARLFRPPFGKRPEDSARICRTIGLNCVLWSLDSGDTMPFTAAQIEHEVVNGVKPGDIVLLHDGGDRRQRTIDASRGILRELGARGYRFLTVSELLGLPDS